MSSSIGKFLISLLFFYLGITKFLVQEGNQHKVQIIHPGISLTDAVGKTLIQLNDQTGLPRGYAMDVETVVCGDKVCRIDTINIIWDELGLYKKIELPRGVTLEKEKGAPFSTADYQKLDTILSNRSSTLKDVYKNEIVSSSSGEGIDAYSGATILLNTKDYIEGAVWTCYTLWHWANGEAYSIIRDITGKQLSQQQLVNYLLDESISAKVFALEQLSQRKLVAKDLTQLVLTQVRMNDYKMDQLIYKYLENIPRDQFFQSLGILIEKGSEKQRHFYLKAILKKESLPPIQFMESVGSKVSAWTDYPSINLFLNLLEEKNIASPAIHQKILPLLDVENFVIARRAYWHLQAQNLSGEEHKRINRFYQKFKDRL